jgi:hypothetical protein
MDALLAEYRKSGRAAEPGPGPGAQVPAAEGVEIDRRR